MDTLPHERQIYDYVQTINHLKKQNQDNPIFSREITKLEEKLHLLKKNVYSQLTPWQRVAICRHASRPHTSDYIKNMCTSFQELKGDRKFGDDPAIIGGLAKIGDMKCVLIGQEKGFDTESRIKCNFGMMNPEGFRKAMRLMRLAERFHLPVVSLLDTPGANPRLEAEERGQGWAIAENLRDMSNLKTMIIVVVIGEGCSGGALGVGIGDVIGMLEHSYYSVISPEGCASILWKDASKNVDAAAALKLNSENLLELGVIDHIIPEPLGGAHHDPLETCKEVKNFILDQWHILKELSTDALTEQRYLKFRRIGTMSTANVS